jgi:hypothetical protein
MFLLFQDIDIEEKLKNAPDSSYEIGVINKEEHGDS